MPRKESVEVFKFDELSKKAKTTAINDYRNDLWEDDLLSEGITEVVRDILMTYLPWAPSDDIRWRLSHSQGDGVAFYGPVDIKMFAEKNPSFRIFMDESKILEIKINIEKSGLLHLYDNENTMIPELVELNLHYTADKEEINKKIAKALEEIISQTQDMSLSLKKEAYKLIDFYSSEENIADILRENDYEFTEDGKIW